ncbi:MAG: hypothetical protein V9G24_17280 [Rhodoblastus sp.]
MRASNAELTIADRSAAPFRAARCVSGVAALLALAAFYALEHPFPGITGDSKIYMGRALADLDPSGVGRDLMFRLDGQSQFSLFTPAARWLLSHLPLALVAASMAAVGGLLWFAGALAVARRAAPGRAFAVAAIVFAAPAFYGPYRLLSYAEALAEPRPYAEAFTLLALAAFLGGRLLPALALLAVAAALHPIMALAGVAAIGLALCVEDRRWLLLALGGALALVAAVALDAPMAGRLRVFIDAQWLSLLTERNAYLFPHLWKADDFILPAIQSATILLAAHRAEGRLRRLLLAGLATGVAGVLIAWIAGALLPSLLVLQAQSWRMWWLTGVLAAFSLALCAVRFGAGAAREKFALAMLAFAWVMASQGPIVFVALGIAVFLSVPRFSRDIAISEKIANYTWLGLAAAVLVPSGGHARQMAGPAGDRGLHARVREAPARCHWRRAAARRDRARRLRPAAGVRAHSASGCARLRDCRGGARRAIVVRPRFLRARDRRRPRAIGPRADDPARWRNPVVAGLARAVGLAAPRTLARRYSGRGHRLFARSGDALSRTRRCACRRRPRQWRPGAPLRRPAEGMARQARSSRA